jgi:hypothetical protein
VSSESGALHDVFFFEEKNFVFGQRGDVVLYENDAEGGTSVWVIAIIYQSLGAILVVLLCADGIVSPLHKTASRGEAVIRGGFERPHCSGVPVIWQSNGKTTLSLPCLLDGCEYWDDTLSQRSPLSSNCSASTSLSDPVETGFCVWIRR